MEKFSKFVSKTILLTIDVGSTVAFFAGQIARNAKRGYDGCYIPLYFSNSFREVARNVHDHVRRQDQTSPDSPRDYNTVGFC